MTEKYAWESKGLDEVAANELYLFIENDSGLYRQQYIPIIKNLVAKKARGVYSHTLAAKLFGYLVDSGAKKYNSEFVFHSAWYKIFPKKVRDAVAEEFRDNFEREYNLGNYRSYTPKKYQTKVAPITRKLSRNPGKPLKRGTILPLVLIGGIIYLFWGIKLSG